MDTVASRRDQVVFELDDYNLPNFLNVARGFGTERYGYVATPNVDGLIRVHESPSFRKEYSRAAYVLLDSRVAAFFFWLVHRKRIPVCPGSDLTVALFQKVFQKDDRVLVIGSTETQVEELRQRYGLTNLIHHNPPMGFIRDPAATEACLQFMETASPFRYCLIAVGDPQGVIIAHRLAERGRAKGLAFIVGASIDFMTGKQKRAPKFVQHMGFEWAFRLFSNPRRMAWRYLVRGPKFFVYLLIARLLVRRSEMPAGELGFATSMVARGD